MIAALLKLHTANQPRLLDIISHQDPCTQVISFLAPACSTRLLLLIHLSYASSKEIFRCVLDVITVIPSRQSPLTTYVSSTRNGDSSHPKVQMCHRVSTLMCTIIASQSVCGFATLTSFHNHYRLMKLSTSFYLSTNLYYRHMG